MSVDWCTVASLVVVSGAVESGPVVKVGSLVVVVVGVVEALPNVGLGVDLILIQVIVHVDVSETVLQLRVVVVRNG